MSGAARLRETVIDGGYCIGCGACAATPGSGARMELDEDRRLVARVDLTVGASDGTGGPDPREVCPFSDRAPNEDELGAALYPDAAIHDGIGRHLRCYAGHVEDGAYRSGGSSGGMGTWILAELLRLGRVDAVVHVRPRRPTEGDPRLFEFGVSETEEGLRLGAKSRYYPVEMSGVLEHVRGRPGRYAVTGLPCFVKAVRLLQRRDETLRDRVAFTVGLVCGHLKSARFADMFAWQLGVEPGDLARFDFRHKLEGRPASRYGVRAEGATDPGAERVGAVADLFGSNWGHGFFKYKACDYCDDVVAELADATVGDAWLPGYVEDWRGTNVVVVRDPAVLEVVEAGRADGRLALDVVDAEDVARSQASGLAHRREGLAYRLHLADRAGSWRPPKRVRPSARGASAKRRKIYELRVLLAEESHAAFREAIRAGSFDVFEERMRPLLARYRDTYRGPLAERLARKAFKAARLAYTKVTGGGSA